VNQWLVQLRGVALELVPAVNVSLNGETLNEAITNVRSEIAATKQRLQSVRTASLPASDQKRLAAEFVEIKRKRAGRGYRPRCLA
jgi:septation ring formation regulator EzrA